MAPTTATPGTRRASPWIARVADRATGCARGRRRSCAAARRTSEAGRRAVLRARLTRAACARLRGAAVLPPAVFIPVRRRAVLRCAGGLDPALLFALFLAADFLPARFLPPLVFLVFFTSSRHSFLSPPLLSLEPGVDGEDGEKDGRGAAGWGGV